MNHFDHLKQVLNAVNPLNVFGKSNPLIPGTSSAIYGAPNPEAVPGYGAPTVGVTGPGGTTGGGVGGGGLPSYGAPGGTGSGSLPSYGNPGGVSSSNTNSVLPSVSDVVPDIER